MGEAALKSHAKGAKHMELEKLAAGAQASVSTMRDWFRPDTPSSSTASSPAAASIFCEKQLALHKAHPAFRRSLVVQTALKQKCYGP